MVLCYHIQYRVHFKIVIKKYLLQISVKDEILLNICYTIYKCLCKVFLSIPLQIYFVCLGGSFAYIKSGFLLDSK